MQNSDLDTNVVSTVEVKKAWHAPVVATFDADKAENGENIHPDVTTTAS